MLAVVIAINHDRAIEGLTQNHYGTARLPTGEGKLVVRTLPDLISIAPVRLIKRFADVSLVALSELECISVAG